MCHSDAVLTPARGIVALITAIAGKFLKERWAKPAILHGNRPSLGRETSAGRSDMEKTGISNSGLAGVLSGLT